MFIDERGFSLLELIIIITISALLYQMIHSIYKELFDIKIKNESLESIIKIEIDIINKFKRDQKLPYPKNIALDKNDECKEYEGLIKEGVYYKVRGQPYCKNIKPDSEIVTLDNKIHKIFISKSHLLRRAGVNLENDKCLCNFGEIHKNLVNYANQICSI